MLSVNFDFEGDVVFEEKFYDAFISQNQQAFFAFLGVLDENGQLNSIPTPTLTDKKEFMAQTTALTFRANYANIVASQAVEVFKKQQLSTIGDSIVVKDNSRKPK